MNMKIVLVLVVLLCGCLGQGPPPPSPENVIVLNSKLTIDSVDNNTGDVMILYTLSLENTGDELLEKIVLKDFRTPDDIVMEKNYFEIFVLHPGEEKAVNFWVRVQGWGLAPETESWEVGFTIRIEKGRTYSESYDFSYFIHLYAK
ncbi:MAG: hypothetical protein PVF58_09325 [Candidatus Methanofastidiosia archaeon]|jgi:hypothetical protein